MQQISFYKREGKVSQIEWGELFFNICIQNVENLFMHSSHISPVNLKIKSQIEDQQAFILDQRIIILEAQIQAETQIMSQL